MNTEQKKGLARTLLLALGVAAIAQACGKETTPVDAPTITGGNGNGGNSGTGGTRGGSSGTAGTDNPGGEHSGGSSGAGGTSGASGTANTGGTGNRGGTGGNSGTGTGADGGSGNEGGAGPDGCVRNPTEPEDFLVRCTHSRCAPFDNFERIPGFNGTLPDL